MGYNMSTNLTFQRIHICHHCGHPFEYKIQKNLSVKNAASESAGLQKMQKQVASTLENKIQSFACPHCHQYQNGMIYRSLRSYTIVALVFAIILILWSFFSVTFKQYLCNPTQNMTFYGIWNVFPAVLILIPVTWIERFFASRVNEDVFIGDGAETYKATRKYYRSIQIFLICTAPAALVPLLGPFLALATFLIYLFLVFRMPASITWQGFPIYNKDVEFHR